ncbi:MAG: hypothetical protein BIFFINMI_02593 [Phycisphaerae bacterium]|nr:hypothetical protein [Phycisphaerae bacterium]
MIRQTTTASATRNDHAARRRRCRLLAILLAGAAAFSAPARASADEPAGAFTVKREAVFEFDQKPAVTRSGDTVTIRFASKGWCDVTVAVEDTQGHIVRHLASGVLGDNAPPPLQKSSKVQTLTWDSKDDQGRYVTAREQLRIRVSLGLAPRFERTLYWKPQRRIARRKPLFEPAPEGVYVYEGNGFDHLRLYSHQGDYERTVYPLPADKLTAVDGLVWHTYPDGPKLPLKTNWSQATMLTSGRIGTPITYFPDKGIYRSVIDTIYHDIHHGVDATAMVVRADRIALAMYSVNRLATDGSSGGMKLRGPKVDLAFKIDRTDTGPVYPTTAALSPDGRWLYLGGYLGTTMKKASHDIVGFNEFDAVPLVYRVDMNADDPPAVFLGSADPRKKGAGDGQFKLISALAVDAQGRVYVADHAVGRVQIFSPEGKFLKSFAAESPGRVQVHQKTGDIYVISLPVVSEFGDQFGKGTVTQFGPFENPRKIASWDLPGVHRAIASWGLLTPAPFEAAVDTWAEPLTVWLAFDWARISVLNQGRQSYPGVQVLQLKEGKLAVVRDFATEARKLIIKPAPPTYWRQRLYANPANGTLYVSESDAGVGKSFKDLIRIDPATGRTSRVELPFDAEDMAFSPDGLAALRTERVIARYDPQEFVDIPIRGEGNFRVWREVPWDYGEDLDKVAFSSSSDRRDGHVTSGIVMPSNAFWHHGGMGFSPRGNLVASGYYDAKPAPMLGEEPKVFAGKPYQVKQYPGRMPSSGRGGAIIHIWNKHGQLIYEDAAPGLGDINGVEIDRDDNIYVLSAAARIFDGVRHFNDMAGTIIRFPPGKGRVLSMSDRIPLPLPDSLKPKRSPDLVGAQQGTAWVEGADWMFAGVGWGGKNYGVGCACWNDRFVLDYFARSFGPEMDRYSVAVLDSAGNLITRIGQYGNVDDGLPLIADGGPPHPRSVGGDEVALMYGAYLATWTDHRLYIADPGNVRLLSVKLGYHADETIALSDVQDAAAGGP